MDKFVSNMKLLRTVRLDKSETLEAIRLHKDVEKAVLEMMSVDSVDDLDTVGMVFGLGMVCDIYGKGMFTPQYQWDGIGDPVYYVVFEIGDVVMPCKPDYFIEKLKESLGTSIPNDLVRDMFGSSSVTEREWEVGIY